MKIILRENVDNLGEAGAVVDVKPGYARNYLIPQGMAVRATKGNLAQIEDLKRQSRRRATQEFDEAQRMREKLEGLTVVIKGLAGETGRLYGSVTNQDIARVLEEEHGIVVDRRRIKQERPFRELGEFSVVLNLNADVENIELPVIVEAENPEDVTRLGEDERELRAESFGIATRVPEGQAEEAGAEPNPEEAERAAREGEDVQGAETD